MINVISQQESPSQNVSRDDAVTPVKPTYSDPSGAIFSMYLNRSDKVDEFDLGDWKASVDKALVFVRLLLCINTQGLLLT